MYTETFLTKPALLQKRICALKLKRGKNRSKAARTGRFSKDERARIHAKTDGRCHFCGIKLPVDKFQADHVVCHTRGGHHKEDNYLPSCFVCNNYRWHYLPIELQVILKLGVWARTEIEHDTKIGNEILERFTKKEKQRVSRSKKKVTDLLCFFTF